MTKFDEKSVISRIKQLRLEHYGPRGRSRFAKCLGVSASTYNYYENDRLAPISILLKICDLTGVDLHWLLLGESSDNQLPHFIMPIAKRLAKVLENNPSSTTAVIAFIDLLEQTNEIQKTQDVSPKAGLIPVIGRTAAGTLNFWHETELPKYAVTQLPKLVEKYTGKAIESSCQSELCIDTGSRIAADSVKNNLVPLVQIADSQLDGVTEFIDSPEICQRFADSFALRVDGDSMAPRIDDGDIVILSPSVPASQGRAAVVKIEGQIGVTCKFIRTSKDGLHLIPINKRYETQIVSPEKMLWALEVLCHVKIK